MCEKGISKLVVIYFCRCGEILKDVINKARPMVVLCSDVLPAITSPPVPFEMRSLTINYLYLELICTPGNGFFPGQPCKRIPFQRELRPVLEVSDSMCAGSFERSPSNQVVPVLLISSFTGRALMMGSCPKSLHAPPPTHPPTLNT